MTGTDRRSEISPWPLSAITYGLCTLLAFHGNTSYRCVCNGWTLKPLSDWPKEYIKLTTCSSVPDYSSLLSPQPTDPQTHLVNFSHQEHVLTMFAWVLSHSPCAEKNCNPHHFQMAEPWVICHEHWDQMQWEKGKGKKKKTVLHL